MFEKEADHAETVMLVKANFGKPRNYKDGFKDGAEYGYNKAKEEAKEIINELLMNGYDESTRAKALDFLYPDKE